MNNKNKIISLVSVLLWLTFGQMSYALTLSEAQKLIASDGVSEAEFGSSLSVSEGTAIIGARADDKNGNNSGAAYVYVRNAQGWILQQELRPSDGAAGDNFGGSVSIAGDTAVVSSSYDDDSGTNSGSAYVFVRNAGIWSEQQKLTVAAGDEGDTFGDSVSLFGDTVIIGATGDDEISTNSGAAYVFVRDAGVWSQQQKLTPSSLHWKSFFGSSISMSEDTAVIAAVGHGRELDRHHVGAAYVFVRSAGVWSLQQELHPSNGRTYLLFGSSVSISGDTALIGAIHPFHSEASGPLAGFAYIFERTGGVWSEKQILQASDGREEDWFGSSVSLSGDTAVIGASWDGGEFNNGDIPFRAGSAYVFARSDGVWIEQQKLIASDGDENDRFGTSVALSGDTLLTGAHGDDSHRGSMYVFEATDSEPPGPATLISPIDTASALPTYSWNAVSNASWYYLWVNDATGTPIKKWYDAGAANCGSGTGTCTVTPTVEVTGDVTWWIRTWNENGSGPWSAALKFSIPPAQATLVSPSGGGNSSNPTYVWNAVMGSSWYYLWVNDSTGNVIKNWITKTDAGCSSGTGSCSFKPDITVNGESKWWIRTWNESGVGPWSAPMNFTP